MKASQDRVPFKTLNHRFDLSNHRPREISPKTKKLMPSIVRLAKLTEVADPSNLTICWNNQNEIENAIKAFLDLVHQRHFPLFYNSEEEEGHYEWDDQTYHPLLNKIPIHSMGFSHHDIEPTDYGDLVALLYWLGKIDTERPKFKCDFRIEKIWAPDDVQKFRLSPVIPILEGMDLKTPLIFLSGLIKSILHETNTFHLDACPLCNGLEGDDLSWTVENFIWFRDDWQKAKPIYEGNEELIKWSSNPERLTEISRISKQAFSIHLY